MTIDEELQRAAYELARLATPNGGINTPVIYARLCEIVGVQP